jgi:hypothetical protein
MNSLTLVLLVCGHYLGDYGLQNDFIAKFKVPGSAPFWFHVMIGHCAIHGGIVALVTQNPYLGLAEFVCHFSLDYAKCKGKISMDTDQAGHLLCKIVWFFLIR